MHILKYLDEIRPTDDIPEIKESASSAKKLEREEPILSIQCSREMKGMQNEIERHRVKIVFAVFTAAIILTTHLSINLRIANASVKISQSDMKAVTDFINKSVGS